MSNLENTKDNAIAYYKAHESLLIADSPDFITEIRNKALASFSILGIPTLKNENYKYTNIEPVFNKSVSYQRFHKQEVEFNLEEIFQCDVPELNSHLVILVNGLYPKNEIPLKDLGNGVVAGSFAEALKVYPELIKEHFAKENNYETDGLVALNTMFANDGLFLYVPKNVIIEKPIQVINLLTSNEDLVVQPRNFICLEENAQAKILICDHTLSSQKYITNSVTEIIVKKNAIIDYYKLQNENNHSAQLATTFITQEQGSTLVSDTITLHGGFVRNNVYVKLNGEYCESNIYGLHITDQWQHVDNFTFIDHAMPNCISNEHYKGVVDDMATAAFTGKILVRPDAQKTQAFQSNSNILLSDDAKIHSKPQLEIYADDVKCSHGASVGQLDENALFYLKARGISDKEAKMLLMYAFADDVISKIRLDAMRERITNLVEKRLRGELSKCNNCNIHCC